MSRPYERYEKTLYLYSCALEDRDFAIVSNLMSAAAEDPVLRGLLFELEAAYQTELALPECPRKEVPTMVRVSQSTNGHYPRAAVPALARTSTRWTAGRILRIAVLGLVIMGVVLLARYATHSPTGVTTTAIPIGESSAFGQQPTPMPVTDHPVITPENADRLVEIRRYGEGARMGAVWSPDGGVAVYGYGIWLYAADTYTLITHIQTDTLIYDAAFSPDGTRLATANSDGTVRLVEVNSGVELFRAEAFENRARYVAYSPDGRLFAAAGAWDDATVRVWDVETGRERFVLNDLEQNISGLEFSSDGSLLAASGLGRAAPDEDEIWQTTPQYVIDVWQTSNGEHVEKLVGATQEFFTFAFSPDGESLSATTWDGTLLTWLVANPDGADQREPLHIWTNAQTQLYATQAFGADYSPDGEVFVTAHNNAYLHFWRETTLVSAAKLTGSDGAPLLDIWYTVAYAPTGTHLMMVDMRGRVVIAAVAERNELEVVANLGDSAGMLSGVVLHGDRVAASGWNGSAFVWDLDTTETVGALDDVPGSVVYDLIWLPETETLILGLSGREDGALLRWDLETDATTMIDGGRYPYRAVYDVAARPQGLIAGSSDGRIQVWRGQPAELLHELDQGADAGEQNRPQIWQAAPSPTSSVIAFTASEQREIRLWDTATGEELSPLVGHSDYPRAVAFAPDGSLLASLDDSENLILWNPITWTEAAHITNAGGIENLVFSPDGALLAVAGVDGVTLWDVAAREQVAHLTAHPGGVQAVTFSEDGTLLATAGTDGLVRLWAVP